MGTWSIVVLSSVLPESGLLVVVPELLFASASVRFGSPAVIMQTPFESG